MYLFKSVHVLCPYALFMTSRFMDQFLMNLFIYGLIFAKWFIIMVLFMVQFIL